MSDRVVTDVDGAALASRQKGASVVAHPCQKADARQRSVP